MIDMFNKHDITRDEFMLNPKKNRLGYDWWWNSFTAIDAITLEEKPFFVEFFICNPHLAKDYPVLGQAKDSKEKGLKPSYLMVNVGTWGEEHGQFHRFFGLNQVSIKGKAPFSITADDCYLDENKTYGSINNSKDFIKEHPEYMCDAGSISWNLTIDKKIAFNVGYGASKLLRKMNAFEMFWHGEGMKTLFSGEIILNGKKYLVFPDKCYGYSDKNWGKDFTSPWVWLASSNLKSLRTGKKLNNSVFDIGGGRPKIGPIILNRKLLSAFYYEGKCYEFNFSKFWTFTRTKFNTEETDTEIIWHVEQKTWFNKMVTDITCQKKDMILINYEAPNGLKLHNRLWNGGNGVGVIRLYHKNKLVDEIEAKNIGCEYGEY